MKEAEMVKIIDMIDRLIMNPDDESVIAAVKAEVHALAARFPLYASEGVLH
jgi:glycine hydroxymethyltransferase